MDDSIIETLINSIIHSVSVSWSMLIDLSCPWTQPPLSLEFYHGWLSFMGMHQPLKIESGCIVTLLKRKVKIVDASEQEQSDHHKRLQITNYVGSWGLTWHVNPQDFQWKPCVDLVRVWGRYSTPSVVISRTSPLNNIGRSISTSSNSPIHIYSHASHNSVTI